VTGGFRLAGHLGLSSPDKPFLAHSACSVAPLDQIDALAAHGFSGVQDLFLKLRTPAEREAMAERMAARGVSLASFGSDPTQWNTPLWTSGDHAAQRESVRESAQVAPTFGGGGAVCVAGIDPDCSVTAQIRAMAGNLTRVAEQAMEARLVLLIEPIAPQRIPGMLLDRLEAAEEVVRLVDMPCVRLMFDIGHVAMMGHNVADALHMCRDIIGVVQAADVLRHDRVAPGLGVLDWPAITRALTRIGYDGLIELEFEPASFSAADETAMLEDVASRLGSWRHPLS
jgi:hydroxypyruvate isomerase